MSSNKVFNFGVDYYPEQWPRERWPQDAQLMAEAGFNVVRLAEFAWAQLEPAEGRFDFAWLDDAIGVLNGQGLRVILGTPTASPPAWLMSRHPELFRVREDGLRLTYGNRREYCPNHPLYHAHTRRIVGAMVEHYAAHPTVVGWQIDNEFGDRCYCPVCQAAFQDWLCDRHQTLDNLNQHWGTAFWSHTYSQWSEIPVPTLTGGVPNPGLALDFYRFVSDSYVAFQRMQLDLIRSHCPTHFITHNFMGFNYDRLNLFDLARDLDLAAWDNYPRTQWNMHAEVDPAAIALSHDTMRGLKHQNFWVMEQQSGPAGWEHVSVMPEPGELRLWAYQAIAHGADGIVFFRWRSARYGTEQYWHGLLDHDAKAGRRYQEIKRMGQELKRIGEKIYGAEVRARVAMLLSYDSRFSLQIQPSNPHFSYSEQFKAIYGALHEAQAAVDIVAPEDDLSRYQIVFAPALHVISEVLAGRLADYVQLGGTLVLGCRSAVKDETNAVHDAALPAMLTDICGLYVEEYGSLPEGVSQPLAIHWPGLEDATNRPSIRVWREMLTLNGAQAIATYTQDFYAGKPAVALHRHGQGQTLYIGAVGNRALYQLLVRLLMTQFDWQPAQRIPAEVEATERWQSDRRLLFILNHTNTSQSFDLSGHFQNLFSGECFGNGTLQIPAKEVIILLDVDSLHRTGFDQREEVTGPAHFV